MDWIDKVILLYEDKDNTVNKLNIMEKSITQSDVLLNMIKHQEEDTITLEVIDDQTIDNELNYQAVRQSNTSNKPVSISTEDLF